MTRPQLPVKPNKCLDYLDTGNDMNFIFYRMNTEFGVNPLSYRG
jgi:hypothetical protein